MHIELITILLILLFHLTILLLIQYASGSLVFYKGVKVNYTRKINHFALFFVPMFIDNIIPVQPSIELLIIGTFFVLALN
jgi:phytol kinase